MKRCGKPRKKRINGTRGVISLFLAILMLPFVSVGGALLNAARVNSAVAVFDEALCNASDSTLGTYDEFLRSRFGLLAMSQDTSSRGGGYTAQNLISDTFRFYMEQNVGVLSNTYVTAETDAAGIYPLADTGVLLSQVLEYSKYTVPARLVIDGFCIDDIIGNLLPKMEMTKSFLGTLTAGTDVVGKLDACEDKFKGAGEALDACKTAMGEYSSAYSAFDAAVREYNRLVDERVAKISECRQAMEDADADIEEYNETMDEEAEKYPGLCTQWSALKNEKDEYGNPVDNSEALEALEEARCIVAVAGMEGALPSVVGGLVSCPVIAVPTSVGYGANLGGLAALLAMLNSCASGVSVVNIDNGFGAGFLAHRINQMKGISE